jgi:hypothetical protein
VHDGVDITTVKGMLAITENAALAMKMLMSEMPAGAGLRIAPAEEPQTLQISPPRLRCRKTLCSHVAAPLCFLSPLRRRL